MHTTVHREGRAVRAGVRGQDLQADESRFGSESPRRTRGEPDGRCQGRYDSGREHRDAQEREIVRWPGWVRLPRWRVSLVSLTQPSNQQSVDERPKLPLTTTLS